MNWILETLVEAANTATWMPTELVFATAEEAKAAGRDHAADPDLGVIEFRLAETTVKPNSRYHAWAGIVTVEEAAELDADA